MRSYLLDLPTSRQRRKEVAVADVTPDGELAAASAVNLVYDPESNNVTIVGGDFAQMIVLLRVVERIEQLHALHGLVLQLKLLAGFTVPEIAKHLDIQPDEADEILRRARTKFRHEWNKATKTGTEDGH
jgi:DNA-directed RNA polymerase specialized sigma24 family protein